MICIAMKSRYSLDTATGMLSSYMEKLKGPFAVFHSAGAATEADWNSTDSSSLVDYWQDASGADWKVKGYTNGRFLAVLYVSNINEADSARQDQFLDSFHF